MIISTIQQKSKKGFALLLTLVVVSVVLAIGLSLLDTTLKQLILSGSAKDSEVAFHAAYAGIECAEYWARDKKADFVDGSTSNDNLPYCMQSTVSPLAPTQSSTHDSGYVHQYDYQTTWGPNNDRCTQIELYIFDAVTSGRDVQYTFNYYNEGTPIVCPDGRYCTVIFSRGYNRACNDLGSIRTIQREIVSQF